MIQETMTHVCRVCRSTNIVKNGTNRCGNAQYHCKDCGTYRVLMSKQAYSETEQQTVLRACLERCSLRGVARIFAMARQTIAGWLKAHVQNLPEVKETLVPATPDDVLELDEIWSFVGAKAKNTKLEKKAQGWGDVWTWTAIDADSKLTISYRILMIQRSDMVCVQAGVRGHPVQHSSFCPLG